jgi:hypothetical protein
MSKVNDGPAAEWEGDSVKSEQSSNLSYQYNRERSRQALCLGFGNRCFDMAIDFQNQMKEEEVRLEMLKHTPQAEWYVDKVWSRVGRMLGGEHLGDMVESELEDLAVDHAFELQRQRVEVASSQSETGEEGAPTFRSIDSEKAPGWAHHRVLSEKIPYIELGRSPPLLSPATDRAAQMAKVLAEEFSRRVETQKTAI